MNSCRLVTICCFLSIFSSTYSSAEVKEMETVSLETIEQIDNTNLLIQTFQVQIDGKVWNKISVKIEEGLFMELQGKYNYLNIHIIGKSLTGSDYDYLKLNFKLPQNYDGTSIKIDLTDGKDGEYLISYSEKNEAYTTWVAPRFKNSIWKKKEKRDDAFTSGYVTLEKADFNNKTVSISIDATLFNAINNSYKTIKGNIVADFSIYDPMWFLKQ